MTAARRSEVGDLPLVLTVEETANALRLGRSATYEAIQRGQIRAVRLGRKLRVPRAELERLLSGEEATA